MNVSFVDYQKQHRKYKQEFDDAWNRVADSRARVLQNEVKTFEENLAKFVGTKYALGVANGTDALIMVLRYLKEKNGWQDGDEVITVGHTFHATVEAIVHNGLKPVLVNVGEDGMIDVKEVKNAVTINTRAVIPVHLMGDMANVQELRDDLAGIVVLEDACQALGSELNGIKAGAWGIAGAFSFFPAKILGAYGDAGAITTNDEDLYKELKDMREHYKYNPGKYGFNSRLDELQAAILNVKLKYLPNMIKRRQEIADLYDAGLKGVKLPTKRLGRVYQDYIIRTQKRDDLAHFLKDNGIETLKNDYHFPDDLPKPEHTTKLESETLRLPCNDVLENEEIEYVIQKVNEFNTK